jgi:hypothetical protein
VSAWQEACFNPDRPDLVKPALVRALTFVKDQVTEDSFLQLFEQPLNQGELLIVRLRVFLSDLRFGGVDPRVAFGFRVLFCIKGIFEFCANELFNLGSQGFVGGWRRDRAVSRV